MAGSLQINGYTKPTLPITLQTNFEQIIWYVAHLIIKQIASLQGIEIREVKKYLHPQRHLQTINITEVDRAYREQENKIRGVNE